MAMRFAPMFPVADLTVARDHYRHLGFTVLTYERGGYGFAALGDGEVHLGFLSPGKSSVPASAHLFVNDADALAESWRASAADVRGPVDTEWGKHGGAVSDPDGNVIRFGPPILT